MSEKFKYPQEPDTTPEPEEEPDEPWASDKRKPFDWSQWDDRNWAKDESSKKLSEEQ